MLTKPGPPKSPRRRYPRAPLAVKARIWAGDDRTRYFSATLRTHNISIGGIFFESTFYLNVGQVLDVEFNLPPHHRKVHARGHVVRVEKLDETGREMGGFAVKFEEYFESSDVVLSNYFLNPVLREFLQGYLRRSKAKLSPAEQDFLIDVLAAWELEKSRGEASYLTDQE